MKKTNFIGLIIAALMLTSIFSACEKSDNASTSGKLTIQLTDAPFPTNLIEEANVTINKIEVRKANEGEEDGNPFIVLSEEEMSFNLLDLTNGVTENLVDSVVEAGSYNLIRLYVAEASIKLKDGQEFDLKIPSGSQTGIKVFIDPAIEVSGGLSADLLLDFDVSKSFVVQGNPNTPAGIKGFHFKPVIKATNNTTAGTLMGVVTDEEEMGLEGVEVAIIAADTVYTTSFTDETGGYAILGIEAGTYGVEFTKENYETATVDEVQIVAGNTTSQDAVLTAITEETAGTTE